MSICSYVKCLPLASFGKKINKCTTPPQELYIDNDENAKKN